MNNKKKIIVNGEIFTNYPDENSSIYVSSSGKVFNIITKKFLKGTVKNGGYIEYKPNFNDGRQFTFYGHKAVAELYLIKPDYAQEVDHIDGNPSNNDVSNLRWVTKSRNIKHSYDLKPNRIIDSNIGSEYRNKPICAIDMKTFKIVKTYYSQIDFDLDNLDKECVRKAIILKGNIHGRKSEFKNSYKQFFWCYECDYDFIDFSLIKIYNNKKMVVIINESTNERMEFPSIQEAFKNFACKFPEIQNHQKLGRVCQKEQSINGYTFFIEG